MTGHPPRIGIDVHSSVCVDADGKVECVCGLDDDRPDSGQEQEPDGEEQHDR